MLTPAPHCGLDILKMQTCLQVQAHHLPWSPPSLPFSYTGLLWFTDADDCPVSPALSTALYCVPTACAGA